MTKSAHDGPQSHRTNGTAVRRTNQLRHNHYIITIVDPVRYIIPTYYVFIAIKLIEIHTVIHFHAMYRERYDTILRMRLYLLILWQWWVGLTFYNNLKHNGIDADPVMLPERRRCWVNDGDEIPRHHFPPSNLTTAYRVKLTFSTCQWLSYVYQCINYDTSKRNLGQPLIHAAHVLSSLHWFQDQDGIRTIDCRRQGK